VIFDLWDVDMGKFYMRLIDDGKYGFIPYIALCNNGSCLAASYVERVNSGGKMIYPEGRKLLNLKVCGMLAVLRMNHKFFKHFEKTHEKELIQMIASIDLSDVLATSLLIDEVEECNTILSLCV
jgi:hypothetical protein